MPLIRGTSGAKSQRLIALLLAAFFAIYMRDPPYLSDITGLDQSWHLMLNYAFQARYQHGRDIIFNYGPLSFILSAYYDPELAPIRAVLATLYYASFGITLVYVLKIDSFLKAGITCLVFLPLYSFRDIHLLIPSLLLCHQEITRRPGDPAAAGISALLGFQMAFMSLVKSPGLFLAAPVLLLVSLYRFSRRDFVPIPLLAFLAATAVLLFVAGQDYSALTDFYVGYLDISEAYNADMQLPAGWMAQAAYVAGGLFLLASISPREPGGLLRGLVFLGYLLVVYKINFTRHGANPYYAFAGLGVALFFQAVLPANSSHSNLHKLALAGVATLSLLFAGNQGDPWRSGTVFSTYGTALKHSLLMSLDPEYREAIVRYYIDMRAAATAKVKEALPFKNMTGPIDVFPFEFSQAYASGLEIATRPAFQAYFATSRLMTERNAAFLDSDRAPKSVLFSVIPIDGRYAAQEDPLTIRAYRRLYRPTDAAGGTLLLERRPEPLVEQEVCRDTYLMFDQTLPLPPVAPGEALWVRIGLAPTAAGQVAGLLLPPPALGLTLTTANAQHSYLYLQKAGEIGFLLSPALVTMAEAARFFAGAAAPQDVATNLKLTAPADPAFAWYDIGMPVALCTLSWREQSP